MKASTIRNADNSKVEPQTLTALCERLASKLERAGFVTHVEQLNSQAIKIGLHMSSFRVDTKRLGHNARVGWYNGMGQFMGNSSPKGYKRTDVPTWDQRVEFNDIVNDVFDKFELTCTIKSGAYTVRSRTGRRSESDWTHEGHNAGYSGDASREIMPEKDAREHCDSDRLEAEYAEKMRPQRLAQAREARARRKAFEASKRVTVAGLWNNSKRNGKQLTHYAFGQLVASLSSWEQRRVVRASMEATLNVAVSV